MTIKKIILLLIICQIVTIVLYIRSGNKKIIIYDVGQGDGILIQYLNNRVIIDGGPNWDIDMYIQNEFIFPICNISNIFITHPQYDHIAGIKRILERCSVNEVIFNKVAYKSNIYNEMVEDLESEGYGNRIKVFDSKVIEGDTYTFGEMKLFVLWPSDVFLNGLKKSENINNISTVLFLDCKDFEAVFTGDIEKKALEQVNFDQIKNLIDGPLDLYKVSHHGASNGMSEKVLLSLKPKTCVISVGKNNRYGHPDQEVLDFLSEINCEVKRTDLDGTIEFKLD